MPPDSLVGLLHARRDGGGRYVHRSPKLGTRSLTYAHLARRAEAGAALLRDRVPHASDGAAAVLLCLPDPLAFATAFFGVAWAGMVPVPAPDTPDTNLGHRRRLASMIRSSRPAAAVVAPHLVEAVRRLAADARVEVEIVPQDDLLAAPETPPETASGASPRPAPAGHDIAYVQYTSGSIDHPKPIVIRQAHVMAQLRQAAAAFAESPDSVSVNWVPLYHDMGLVTSALRPLWSDYVSVLLDPNDFVRDPELWPAAMTEWAATHTSSPDFGYALCAAKTRDSVRFDLSTLRVARSAGEMVRPRTLRAFTEAFAAAGFDPAAFKPSYGMAEATLTVTTCPYDQGPKLVRVSRAALRDDLVREPADPDDELSLVSAGPPLAGATVRIAGPDGAHTDDEMVVGEVVIAGPQVVADDPATGTRRTGDLGFLWRGELVLLGRGRERFQIRGQNYYSGEIEAHLTAHEPRLRPGRAAVFVTAAPDADQPALAVVAEVRADTPMRTDDDAEDLRRSVRRLVGMGFGLAPERIEFTSPGTVPVTTSGKIRREVCRQLLETAGLATLRPGGTAAWTPTR